MTMKKLFSMLLAAVMVLSIVTGCFAAQGPAELQDTDVLATVNGAPVTWADTKADYDYLVGNYGSYYDLTQQSSIDLFRAVALEDAITMQLIIAKATELGLLPLTDEETAEVIATADSNWEEAVESYLADANLAEDASDEDKAAARADAEAQLSEASGYTKESWEETCLSNAKYNKLYEYYTKDITVSDEDVQAAYDEQVAADKALYENDLEGYCNAISEAEMMAYYNYMYTGTYSVEYPAYKPAGFRVVKHVLLSVDEALMNTYNELQATYEEQQNPDESAETTETAETAEPVTLEQIEAAHLAILDSVADKVKTVQDSYAADPTCFDTLIANYSADSGNSYEVCAYTTNYVTPFVEAAMSIPAVGELSAPTVSQYGVHILLFVAESEGGAVARSEEEVAAARADLLQTKQSEAYNTAIEEMTAAAAIEYTGVIPNVNELQSEQAEEAAAEETVAEETTEQAAE